MSTLEKVEFIGSLILYIGILIALLASTYKIEYVGFRKKNRKKGK